MKKSSKDNFNSSDSNGRAQNYSSVDHRDSGENREENNYLQSQSFDNVCSQIRNNYVTHKLNEDLNHSAFKTTTEQKRTVFNPARSSLLIARNFKTRVKRKNRTKRNQ